MTAFWALTLLMILPLWVIDPLPLVDLPSHIARAAVLHRYESSPYLRSIYYLVVEPIPNVGIDLILMGLQRAMPVQIAAKVLLTLIVLLFAIGVRKVFETFQPESDRLLWLAPLLAYHAMWLYGFLNYDLGIGLFFLTFVYWFKRRERLTLVSAGCVVLLSIVCYLSHLSSYALLLVGVGATTMGDIYAERGRWKRGIVHALPVAFPLVLLFLFVQGSGSNRGMVYGNLKGKITSFLVMVRSYDVTLDALLLAALIVILAVAWMAASKRVIDRQAAIVAAVFLIAYILCPEGLFTASLADARIVPACIVFLIASITIRSKEGWPKLLFPAVICLLAVRVCIIVGEWKVLSDRMESDLALGRVLPDHSRVRTLYYEDVVVLNRRERPFGHLPSYFMLDRDISVTNFFGQSGMQPVVFRHPPAFRTISSREPLNEGMLDTLTAGLDHIWAYKLDSNDNAYLGQRYARVASNDEVSIYRVR